MSRALTVAAVLVVALVAAIPFLEVLEEWDPFPHSEYDIVLNGAIVLLGTMCAVRIAHERRLRCVAGGLTLRIRPVPQFWASSITPAVVAALSPPPTLRI